MNEEQFKKLIEILTSIDERLESVEAHLKDFAQIGVETYESRS